MEKAQKRASLLLEVTAVTTANSVVTTFSNGSLFPSLGHQNERASAAAGVQMDPVLGKEICIYFSKGHLISKPNCQAMNPSRKQTNEFVFTNKQLEEIVYS